MQRPTGSSKRSVMRENEREKEREKERERKTDEGAKEKAIRDLLVSSKRFERSTCEVCNHAFNSQSRNVTQSGARARETSGSSYTKRKPNAAKHDELMD